MAENISGDLNINEKTKAGFNALYAQREQIEKEFGSPLLWNELPTKIMSTIGITKDNADIMNEDDWENQFAWLVDKLEKLDKVFRRRVRELPGNE